MDGWYFCPHHPAGQVAGADDGLRLPQARRRARAPGRRRPRHRPRHARGWSATGGATCSWPPTPAWPGASWCAPATGAAPRRGPSTASTAAFVADDLMDAASWILRQGAVTHARPPARRTRRPWPANARWSSATSPPTSSSTGAWRESRAKRRSSSSSTTRRRSSPAAPATPPTTSRRSAAAPALFGCVGRDDQGARLIAALDAAGVDARGVVRVARSRDDDEDAGARRRHPLRQAAGRAHRPQGRRRVGPRASTTAWGRRLERRCAPATPCSSPTTAAASSRPRWCGTSSRRCAPQGPRVPVLVDSRYELGRYRG